MKNEIKTDGKYLAVNGCAPIEFEEEIERTLDMENVVVVLTIPERGYLTANRIYGVKDRRIAWRVQDMLEYDENCAPFMPDPYTGIRVYDKDTSVIIATTSEGFRFLINPNNGRIIGTESWVK